MIITNNTSKTYFKFFVFTLIWISIDGIFRKWIFPEFSNQIFAVKYLFFTFSYIIFLLQNPFIHKIKSSYQFFIPVLAFYCLFQFLYNPISAPLLVRIFGIINYLFFIPLIMIVPVYFSSTDLLEKFIKFLAYFSIPIFTLGIIQYYLPIDHILNIYVNDIQQIAVVGKFTRSNSIFTFVKVYSVYLVFVLTVTTSYIFYLLYQGKRIAFFVTVLSLGILNLIMTASRLPLSLFVFNALLIFATAFFFIKQLRYTIISILFITLLSFIILLNTDNALNEATDALIARSEHSEKLGELGMQGYSAKDRVIDQVNIFIFSEEAGSFGFGIGTTYQGTDFFLSKTHSDIRYEEEGERIVLELGVIGGIIMFLLRLSIFLYAIKIITKIKHINYIFLILPFVLYLFPPVLFLSHITFSYYEAFFYWFTFGLVLAIERSYQAFLYKNKNSA